jgi:hypothetical protein
MGEYGHLDQGNRLNFVDVDESQEHDEEENEDG